MLAKYFLLFNALLYVALGAWCTIAPLKTATAIGYGLPNNSARSEYIVVYGGLEIGMGLFFLVCAFRPGQMEAGLWFSALLYTCLMVFRIGTILTLKDLSWFIYSMVTVETVMTAASWWLLWTTALRKAT